jgi:branched-chain amino acid transport system substrate-binding protein
MAANEHNEDQTKPHAGAVSRRDFLRVAAITGAVAGLGGGLGGILSGCGGKSEPLSSSQQVQTSVTAGVQTGQEVKLGYLAPVTGSMATWGTSAKWLIDYFNKNVWKDGLVMGDGKKHRVTVLTKDTQSDSGFAAKLASSLILDSEVLLLGTAAGADGVLAVRDTAEELECPCVTYNCSADAWALGRPSGGFKWCWHTWFSLADLVANVVATWDSLQTNKKVGVLYPDDGDGRAFLSRLPKVVHSRGYTVVDPGRVVAGATDYSSAVSLFLKEGVEIVNGVLAPADFAGFWRQCRTQGFTPKISTQSGALIFPDGIEALGGFGSGQTVECWFHPSFEYKSSVTGLTAAEVCTLWEQQAKVQWNQSLVVFGQLEVFTDVLTRPVDWTANPEARSGVYNFCSKPVCEGQWVKGTSSYPYDMQVVASATQKAIRPSASVQYLSST